MALLQFVAIFVNQLTLPQSCQLYNDLTHSIYVQGKGIMTTYWLKNMDGFNRALPSDDMAVSESQHEFK